MKGFLGIDIGTANSKALLLSEEGTVIYTWSKPTPHVRVSGLDFFDINKIEKVVEQFISEARKRCQLKSVSFSSVGESVVPVKNGKAIENPLIWHEDNFAIDKKIINFIEQYAGFENTGVNHSKTYAIYKMIWLQEHLLHQIPDFWLPISSYFIYRKTGCAIWDTSQAGRSYVYNIHQRKWIEDITGELIPAKLGDIGMIGTCCGYYDGIIYGLGGHDHYVGLYGIYELHGNTEIFYDSMGSSSVLAMVKKDPHKKLGGRNTYNPKGGSLVTGFNKQEYIVNRSFDYYGRVISCLINIRGDCADNAYYNNLNIKIGKNIKNMRPCLITCKNDFNRASDKIKSINFLHVSEKASFEEMVLGGYYYLALCTQHMFNDLLKFCSDTKQTMFYFAGGGIVNNDLFMKLKATVLGREVMTPKVSEISALGAAISAVKAAGYEDILPYAKNNLLDGNKIYPDRQYEPLGKEMMQQYEEINK